MIVWLASWPRSGNTLLRIKLQQGLGIDTWSVYDDKTDIGSHVETAKIVGHRSHGQSRDEFARMATALPEVFYVKTHELPSDDSPAIYVVRDGRSAVVSWRHYCEEFTKSVPSLEEIIRGAEWPGSWSQHVRAWALSGRPRTLVVRYEDFVSHDTKTLEAVSAVVGRAFPSTSDIPFGELHGVFPKFFRAGSNEKNVAELSPDLANLFEEIHGDVLTAMGYKNTVAGGWDVIVPQGMCNPRPATLEARLAAVEANREAYLTFILQQGAELSRLRPLEAERDALSAALTFAEADREARLAVIHKQGAELGRIPGLEAERDDLAARLVVSEADREARLAVIQKQGAELGRIPALEAERDALSTARDALESELRSAMSVLDEIRNRAEGIQPKTLLGMARPSEVRRLTQVLSSIAALAQSQRGRT